MDVERQKCTKCGICSSVCKLDIKVYETPNSPECIRCGECKKACMHNAIKTGFKKDSQNFPKKNKIINKKSFIS